MRILYLTADDIRRALPMSDAVELMKKAYVLISSRAADIPERSRLREERVPTQVAIMPVRLHDLSGIGVKIIGYNPENRAGGQRSIDALMVVVDPKTGHVRAIIDGTELTSIRTGAGIGAATDILARKDASLLALFGSGVQASTALEAICSVRPLSEVRIYSPTRSHANRLAEHATGNGWTAAKIIVADSPAQAINGATIVCTATDSSTPVFDGRQLAEGVHISALGSYSPAMQELDRRTILRARVFVDHKEHSLLEAGEFVGLLEDGSIDPTWIIGEIGEVIVGRVSGRTSNEETTLFKSVGNAVQDIVAAQAVLDRAIEDDQGVWLPQ